jgi:hypothetical protein
LEMGYLCHIILPIMKVLLRNEMTGLYVGREKAWAKQAEAALEFVTLEAAVRKTLDYVREDVVIVLRGEDPERGLAS